MNTHGPASVRYERPRVSDLGGLLALTAGDKNAASADFISGQPNENLHFSQFGTPPGGIIIAPPGRV